MELSILRCRFQKWKSGSVERPWNAYNRYFTATNNYFANWGWRVRETSLFLVSHN
jgi:hypothetical protein